MIRTMIVPLMLATSTASVADPARIEAVEAHPGTNGWSISVTLRHDDTGWEDYANGWRVLAPDGTVLGTRVLAHPHVNEQPFTRSLGGVDLPNGLTELRVEASTSPEGWGGQVVSFALSP